MLNDLIVMFTVMFTHPLGANLELGLAEVGDHPLTIDAEELGNL